MKKTNIKITRYEHGNYYIDIVENENDIEWWICEKNNGISIFQFGELKHNRNISDYVREIKILLDDYISGYDRDILDIEQMYNNKFLGANNEHSENIP